LIVADGVGGWADSGIDPGLYSKKLVSIMEELATKEPEKYITDPK
jgi:protein phosphatase PTC7